jgi:hypothetical protein
MVLSLHGYCAINLRSRTTTDYQNQNKLSIVVSGEREMHQNTITITFVHLLQASGVAPETCCLVPYTCGAADSCYEQDRMTPFITVAYQRRNPTRFRPSTLICSHVSMHFLSRFCCFLDPDAVKSTAPTGSTISIALGRASATFDAGPTLCCCVHLTHVDSGKARFVKYVCLVGQKVPPGRN